MFRLIKKSIFVLKNYGPKVFILKVIRFSINRFNLFKQNLANKKAYKNKEKAIQLLKSFNSGNFRGYLIFKNELKIIFFFNF